MEFLDKISRRLNQALAVIAGVSLAAMIALTVGNIWSRILWVPINGTVELIGFFGAIAAAFTLGFSQMHNAHTAVDILVLKFPKKLKSCCRHSMPWWARPFSALPAGNWSAGARPCGRPGS